MALTISCIKYLSVFFFALLFFKVAEQEFLEADKCSTEERKHRKISRHRLKGIGYALIAMLIISLFAGLRADTVGVDTSGYPRDFMRIASGSTNFADFIRRENDVGPELLGALLVYVSSIFTKDSWLLLFFYQLFTVLPVYLAVYQLRNDISTVLGMSVYLFWFFNNSLNMMRQSMACGFILLGIALVYKRKRVDWLAILSFSCAVLLHRSGIYGAILVIAVFLAFRISKTVLRVIVYIGAISIPSLIIRFSSILNAIGQNDMHVRHYLDVFVSGQASRNWFVNPLSSYSLTYIIICVTIFLLPKLFELNFFINPRLRKRDSKTVKGMYGVLRSVNLTGLLIYIVILFSMRTMYGIRFSIFFDYFYIISLPLAVKAPNKKFKKEVLIMFLFLIWLIWIMRMGWSGSELYETRF